MRGVTVVKCTARWVRATATIWQRGAVRRDPPAHFPARPALHTRIGAPNPPDAYTENHPVADLKITALHKYYGAMHAVRGIDLEIPAGEFTVLVGQSGCG